MSRNIGSNKRELTKEELSLRDTQSGKLIFTTYRGRKWALLCTDNRLISAEVLPNIPSKIGAIYIGKVKNVVSNIDACFVEITNGELCFLPLKEAQSPFILNRAYDGRIKEGDELLVQVTRDAQKTKQASVTAHVSLSNDYFAFSIGSSRIGYSGKLSRDTKNTISVFLDEQKIAQNGKLVQEEGLLSIGMVVRTQANELENNQLLDAYTTIREAFITLLQTAKHRTCFSCLQEPKSSVYMILDQVVYPYEYDEIITDDAETYRQLQSYCKLHMPDKNLRLYEDNVLPLEKLYSINSKIDTALNTRVWLKSGGYLVVEPTEALTVIDVNSGKYDAKKVNLCTTIKINQEAAREIALQLRLRNLSGIIVVDFINMDSDEANEELVTLLRKLVQKDKTKTKVIDMTALGLVEITRKKVRKPLHEQFAEASYE